MESERTKAFRSGIAVPLHDGWKVVASIELTPPDTKAMFMIQERPAAVHMDEEQLAGHWERLLSRHLPSFELLGRRSFVCFGGLPVVLSEFRWQEPDGQPVRQMQAYALVDGRSYVATVTCPEAEFESQEEGALRLLREMEIALAPLPTAAWRTEGQSSSLQSTYVQLERGEVAVPVAAKGHRSIVALGDIVQEPPAEKAWEAVREEWKRTVQEWA